jgi:hypothetical protein
MTKKRVEKEPSSHPECRKCAKDVYKEKVNELAQTMWDVGVEAHLVEMPFEKFMELCETQYEASVDDARLDEKRKRKAAKA